MSTTSPTGHIQGFDLAWVGTIAHAVLLLGLFVLYVVYVPSAKKTLKKTFDEFGLTLHWLTLSVIRLSNWITEYWWALALVLVFVGAADFWMTAELSAHNRFAAVLWVAGVGFALAAVAALTVFAIELSVTKLKEGLAR
jgi:type II secretory pathway component PulF